VQHDELKVNFKSGDVTVHGSGRSVSLVDLATTAKQAIHYEQLSLAGVTVSVSAVVVAGRLTISIDPPGGLSFWDCDKRAGEIAAALESILSQPESSSSGRVVFPWGELTVRSEWRDGGWGATLSYVRT
jgi:hypothetical protein